MESTSATSNFILACKQKLTRIESFINKPMELKNELESFNSFLTETWPNFFNELNEKHLPDSDKAEIQKLFLKITEIEEISKQRSEWFDDLKKFMQTSIKK